MLGDFTLLQELGHGATSQVVTAIHRKTERMVAIKILNLSLPEVQATFDKEVMIMHTFHHPRVIKMFGAFREGDKGYIVMQYAARGDLGAYIASQARFTERSIKRMFRQIVDGVKFLHEHNIIHRDIKPENILVDRNYNCVVSDFGLSKLCKGAAKHTACGTPAYSAPEVIKREEYSTAADVWSLGVILYLMATGRFAFPASTFNDMYHRIVTGNYDPFPEDWSPELVDLVQKLLVPDPAARIKIGDVMNHKWFDDIGSEPVGRSPLAVEYAAASTMASLGYPPEHIEAARKGECDEELKMIFNILYAEEELKLLVAINSSSNITRNGLIPKCESVPKQPEASKLRVPLAFMVKESEKLRVSHPRARIVQLSPLRATTRGIISPTRAASRGRNIRLVTAV